MHINEPIRQQAGIKTPTCRLTQGTYVVNGSLALVRNLSLVAKNQTGCVLNTMQCRQEDSNPQPTDYKSVALPIELHRRHWLSYAVLTLTPPITAPFYGATQGHNQ